MSLDICPKCNHTKYYCMCCSDNETCTNFSKEEVFHLELTKILCNYNSGVIHEASCAIALINDLNIKYINSTHNKNCTKSIDFNPDEPIGISLGDGKVELNHNGIKMVCREVKGQMSEKEVLAKVNKKLTSHNQACQNKEKKL